MFTNVYRLFRQPVRRGALLGCALVLFWVAAPLAADALPLGSDPAKNLKVQADWGRLPLSFWKTRARLLRK